MHGGQLSRLAQLFPDAPRPWIDLSTGINPHAYPYTPFDAALLSRLPDPTEEQALREAAACAYGVSARYVLSGPGSQALIGLLPVMLQHLMTLSRLRILTPTYSGHEAAWRAAGVNVESLPHGACIPIPSRNTVTIICTPNNPTGHVLSLGEIESLAESHARMGGLVIVDEAYADFQMQGAARLLPHPGLIICRSLGKAYGLAGLRVGFLLGSHPVLHDMRAALGPWSVGTLGCHIGREALLDVMWRDRMALRLEADSHDLRRVVVAAGLDFVGGTTLFSLFRSPRAVAIAGKLAQAGLLVRQFDWDDALLRFGMPRDEATLARIDMALRT
ncbi:L-threonine-O-3-phosphate decarboxylase [Asaia krungthepensis NRIC 0535]|uniref:Aminotransferase n=2 Tax=Asaia krungthepensis TaxID=220990 RepID=A0ABQ0Q1B0_9PROT|nr:L-threonine-O-3-phosphate decarboxylase [Asaia krungthepensis NRIC 0535]